MIVQITGWGMFWAGLTLIIIVGTITNMIESMVRVRALTKACKALSEIDHSAAAEILKKVMQDKEEKDDEKE